MFNQFKLQFLVTNLNVFLEPTTNWFHRAEVCLGPRPALVWNTATLLGSVYLVGLLFHKCLILGVWFLVLSKLSEKGHEEVCFWWQCESESLSSHLMDSLAGYRILNSRFPSDFGGNSPLCSFFLTIFIICVTEKNPRLCRFLSLCLCSFSSSSALWHLVATCLELFSSLSHSLVSLYYLFPETS